MKLDKDDRAIIAVSNSIMYILYYILAFEFDFSPRKLLNFYNATYSLKLRYEADKISSHQLLTYCLKKGVNVGQFVKGIKQDKKMRLVQRKHVTLLTMKMVEAALVSNLMLSITVLKERYRFTRADTDLLMRKVAGHIDDYVTRQPKLKRNYLDDSMIIEWFKDEYKLDITTGKMLKE